MRRFYEITVEGAFKTFKSLKKEQRFEQLERNALTRVACQA
jgi:hypothetical protein